MANWPTVPGPIAGWQVVACSAGGGGGEKRLSFLRNSHTSFAAAGDCGTIPIYEYTPLGALRAEGRRGMRGARSDAAPYFYALNLGGI